MKSTLMNWKSYRSISIFFGILILSLITFFIFPYHASSAETILIGVPLPFSPPGSVSQGSEAKAGIEVAVKMLNEQGGILGRDVKLLYEDTQGIPEKGRSAVEKLITKDNVTAIVGNNHSSVGMAVTEVVHQYGTPFVNVNCWANAIREKGYKEVFNTAVYNSRMAMAGAELIKNLGLKNVVAFAENTDFGIGLAKNLQTYVKQMAPATDYKYEVLDREAKDFAPAIATADPVQPK